MHAPYTHLLNFADVDSDEGVVKMRASFLFLEIVGAKQQQQKKTVAIDGIALDVVRFLIRLHRCGTVH